MRPHALPFLLLLITIAVATDCNAHYYSSNGTCLQCDFSCYNCSGTPTNCLTCQEGLYLSGNACLPCNTSCVDCLNLLQCKSCHTTYRLASQTCLPCGPNCDFCNDTACTICSGGYDIKSNCSSCAGGFYWNTTRTACLRCGIGCSNCNYTRCLACNSRYQYRNGTCYSIQAALPTQSPQKEDQSQLRTEVILALVFGGSFILGIVAYSLYSACWSPSGGKRIKDVGVALCKSQSIKQDLMSNCLICSSADCDLVFSCGHNYHSRCLQSRECTICRQDIKEAPLFLQDVLRGADSEAPSDVSSQISRKEVYREGFSCDSFLEQSHVEVQ